MIHHSNTVTQTPVQLELLDDVSRNDELGRSGFTLFAWWLRVSQAKRPLHLALKTLLAGCLFMAQPGEVIDDCLLISLSELDSKFG